MASSSSPEANEELRRDYEHIRARLDFEMRQNKEEVDFLRTHCQKKLDFERERAKENETAFEQRLLALRAEKDSQIQEFRKVIEQLEADKQQLQERVCRLEERQLVPTRLKNDQQVQTSEVPGDLNSRHRSRTRHMEPVPSTGSLTESSSVRQVAIQDTTEGSTTLPPIEVCRQAIAHLQNVG
ncbi:hypothetical protein ACEPAH_6211 [Sanghuangporus vaninii]